ncbi:thiamine pyrophosphate-dependent dehydrogenase E1 component subunit alpha [Halocatena salina]|uniref:Thiamine pyrophosphate-dependent enzyme n=1 Tax=Halocatena salina TaxID=2934340 RepID=A0A8U0A7F0_9EURY|nr:thiamine pyrophosphate-dependent enzyme [Halocatena salina]UPM45032.1 thiamine pyrophosphate-dependent enzyme [Halocatena salina]
MAQEMWTEERPPGDFYRILDPDGELETEAPEMDEEELLQLYRTFIATRVLEEKMLNMQRSGEVSLVARTLGEEATPLGGAAALQPDDWIFHTYRQTPALLYWDRPMVEVIASATGREPETIAEQLDTEDPAVNFSPDYTPIGTNVVNGVGAAMADAFNDRDTVTMVFTGDGSTSQGAFHDGMNFAGVFDVPAVIICQNNQWAISEPAHRQTGSETFAQKAAAYGLSSARVDGNDVFAVYEKAREAVERARSGGGATFIECVTYRMGAHNTSDNPNRYRDDSEQREYWEDRDPVDRYDTYLRNRGILDDDTETELRDEIDDQVADAVEQVRSISNSEPDRMFDTTLHGESWRERHQRAELHRELNGKNPFVDFTGEGFNE